MTLSSTYHWSSDYAANAQSEDNNDLSRFSPPPCPEERLSDPFVFKLGAFKMSTCLFPSGFIERDLSPSDGTIPPGLISISNRLFFGGDFEIGIYDHRAIRSG